MANIVHGTYAGWQQHQKRGETACSSCREAATQYIRSYRAASPDARRKNRWWCSTRSQALEQLVTEHPQRFLEILAEIRAQRLSEL